MLAQQMLLPPELSPEPQEPTLSHSLTHIITIHQRCSAMDSYISDMDTDLWAYNKSINPDK